jgi:dephospho-CoA kinase
MLKVGVTGGIGSGKTLICSVISAMGYPVFNADLEARQIIDNDPNVVLSVKKLFGDSIYTEGILDRKKVAEIVFSNPILLEELNAIVHPAVGAFFDAWVLQFKSRSLVIKEAAILFESGAYKSVDKTIVVTAPLEIRVKRVMDRDKVSRDVVINRLNNQFPQEELVKRADFVIENDEVQLLLPQIVKVIDILVKA